jgi:hypothetical protein
VVSGGALGFWRVRIPPSPIHMASQINVALVFNAAHPLARPISSGEIQKSLILNESPNPGPIHELGVGLQEAVIPRLLKPTNVFHQELSNRLAEIGVHRAKKQPFEVTLSTGAQARLTLQLRIIPPNVLCLTAWLKGVSVDVGSFASELVELQRIDEQTQVLRAMSCAVGMVESVDHRSYEETRPRRVVPALDLAMDPTADATTWVENHERELVGVLIRDSEYERMAPSLVEAVIAKNRDLNVKTTREVALLDKQGALYVSDNSGSDRFRRLALLQSIALAYEIFLSSYRTERSTGIEFYDFVLGKLLRWVEMPDPVFRSSVSNRYAWVLIRDEFKLVDDVAEILDSEIVSTRLADSKDLFDRLSQRWWEQPNFPEILSETLAEERDGSQFSFVDDGDLRKIIAADLREAEVTLQARAFKASMVLSGSVAEAMLLAAVLRAPGSTVSESTLLGEGLQQLAQRAQALGLVSDQNTIDLVDQWLRDYRNLVHPGRQKRTAQYADENKAAIALRAVQGLAQELS